MQLAEYLVEELSYDPLDDKIEVEEMRFEWENECGELASLEVSPYYWFPCTRKQSKMLSPLLTEQKRLEILDYLQKALVKSVECQEQLSEKCRLLQDKIAEATYLVERGRYPNGVYLNEEEAARLQRNFRYMQYTLKDWLLELKRLKRRIEKYNKNLKDFA